MIDFPNIVTKKWEKDPHIRQFVEDYTWRGVHIPVLHRHDGDGIIRSYGFLTDFRSGGRFVSLLIPQSGPLTPAWVNHDHRYAFADTLHVSISRKEVDDQMYKDLRACGASRWTARTAWFGVRVGGWVAWNKNRKRERDGTAYDYHYAIIRNITDMPNWVHAQHE